MAVVSISRIQVRRGQKNAGSGLPQLASGEFGWAVDSQELYIGNGSVAEGAPYVGNTKLLSETDNLFEFANTYQYKSGTNVQTGDSANNPVLRTLQARLDDIHALGATLVAISPQVPDGSLTKDEISNMDFIVLSDQDAKVALQYGVAWEVPEFLAEHMRVGRKLDLEKINNGNSNVLPIPATFVLDPNGKVTWRYVNVDYRTRSEPDEIIEALKKLS